MYGGAPRDFPRRVVCLSAETAEIAHLVGAGDRVVGEFTTFHLDRILGLHPDLVLAFSDLQRDVVHDLIGTGVAVLCTNPRSLEEVLGTILVIGGALGCDAAARALVQDMTDEMGQVREYSATWADRPRVYFEEWGDPPISGIRWISELIEIAGGHDVFPELRSEPSARARIVAPEEVVRRDPQIILASWCGKPVEVEAIRGRPGWDGIAAVRAGQIHEIDGADILAPGPSLMAGLRRIHEIVQTFQAST